MSTPAAVRAAAVGLLAGLAVLGAAGPAAAHTRLAVAAPADGSTVAADLDGVVLTLSGGPVEPALSTVLLTGPGGRAAAGTTSADRARVVLALDAPSPPATGRWPTAWWPTTATRSPAAPPSP